MKISLLYTIALGLLIALPIQSASAKAAGSLLKEYVDNGNRFTTLERSDGSKEYLALVEVSDVVLDKKVEKNWVQTGTLMLRPIEVVGGTLPKVIKVRFYKRRDEGFDEWTWDYVILKKGKRLLAFVNNWSGTWGIRKDGMSDIINNVEKIDPEVLARLQSIFKTPLSPSPQNIKAPVKHA